MRRTGAQVGLFNDSGAIKYELDDDSKDGISCHCRTCQKLHTASSFNLKSQQDKVRVVKGTPKSYRDKKADAGSCITRYFCGDCGSALYSDPDSLPGVRFVKVGALEDAQVGHAKAKRNKD